LQRRFSGCELYFATVGELNITPDEWSAAFNNILSCTRAELQQISIAPDQISAVMDAPALRALLMSPPT
jgi:hypothetical protein